MLFDIIEPRYASLFIYTASICQIFSTPLGIHVTESRVQLPTSHCASPKAFKNSNLNSSLHRHEKQSRVRSPLVQRTSSKLLKASKAGSYSGRRLLSLLAVRALAQAR